MTINYTIKKYKKLILNGVSANGRIVKDGAQIVSGVEDTPKFKI